MFLGVTSHHDAKRVRSYSDAERVLIKASKTPTGKQRTEKPNGFTLYDTEVVTWESDGSVLIDNFGTVTTSGFAARFLPAGIHLRYPVSRRGEEGGDKAISYRTTETLPGKTYNRWGLCRGNVVRFVEDVANGVWLPDETTCEEMTFPERNGADMKALNARYHLKDFAIWLGVAPHHTAIEHDCWSVEDCLAALEKRDFMTASMFLPPIKPGGGFGLAERVEACALPFRGLGREEFITPGSIDKLKLAMLEHHGGFGEVKMLTIPSDEYAKRMAQVRAMRALGIDAWGMGAD